MSLREHDCPGCMYGGTHLQGCKKEEAERLERLGIDPDCQVHYYHMGDGKCTCPTPQEGAVIEEEITRPVPEKYVIEQKIIPSTGTKLICTTCGRGDWHTLILRRRSGLLEGLCKQTDGSGCYPVASRRNCSYTYPNQMDCPQVAEYTVALGKDKLHERQVCRDHIGEAIGESPLYLVWPLED